MATDHREEASQWAISALQEPNVVFLDTETTGLGEDAEIIDIAIVDRNGRVLFDSLVRPSDLIPPSATSIHGIDNPAVVDAPTWDQIYPLIGRILDQYGPVVVYNADFDRRILEQTNRLYELPDFPAEWRCAMKQFAAYVGVWHDRYDTWRWRKLTDALKMLRLPEPAIHHRALSDAESCRQVVEAMAAGVEPTTDARSPDREVAVPPAPERIGSGTEPIRPDIIGPGDERFGPDDDPNFETRIGAFPGGQYTVISTKSTGCSPGLLVAILIGGTIVIVVGCCFFFYAGARLVF